MHKRFCTGITTVDLNDNAALDTMSSNADRPQRRVPASLFGIVLGVAGLGGAWRVATRLWSVPLAVADTLSVASLLIWAGLLTGYVFTWIRNRPAAQLELHHPIAGCFVSLVPVSTSVVAVATLTLTPWFAHVAFVGGAIAQFAFGVFRTGALWKGGTQLAEVTPALYLPNVAGNLTSALAAAAMNQRSWAMFFFAIGVLQWTVLESIVVFRYLTGPDMLPPLRPSLGLHLAPPAVAAATWLAIVPQATLVPYLLWAYALFIACVLMRLLRWISSGQFTLGLWSFSFGITAMATGALTMLERHVDGVLVVLGPASFLLANLVIALLIAGTLREAAAGRLLPAT